MKLLSLLKKTARSFYLTIRLLPPQLQEPVALAYLLARASDTVADEGEAPCEERVKLLYALQKKIDQPYGESVVPLTRIFHTNLLRRPGRPMDTALDSDFDLDSMYSYSPASKSSSALSHQPLRPSRHDQHEISGLIKNYCEKKFSPAITEKQRAERELLSRLPELLQHLEDPKRTPLEADAIKEVWRRILEGQLLDLKLKGTLFTSAERERYLYLVAGCVGAFWTKIGLCHMVIFSRQSYEQMSAWSISYGKGLQLVNILRDAPLDREAGRFYFESSEFAALLSQAYTCLQEGRMYLRALPNRRLRYASSLPLLLGEKTLALLAKHPHTPFLKISRWEVLATLIQALFL